jgi:hypothetical protein
LSGEEGLEQTMQISLLAIAKKAQNLKGYRFLNLYRLIDENLLVTDSESELREPGLVTGRGSEYF